MSDQSNEAGKPEPTDDGYRIDPSDPGIVDHEPAVYPLYPEPAVEEVPEERPGQFSLAELMLLVTLVAMLLGILGLFPPDYAAGLAGLGALASTIVLTFVKSHTTVFRVLWWAMLFIYALTCIVAVARST
jgi:hypothetical protein